ncbi:MAG: class F sortase, partial [Ornithinimicrobium sp.]
TDKHIKIANLGIPAVDPKGSTVTEHNPSSAQTPTGATSTVQQPGKTSWGAKVLVAGAASLALIVATVAGYQMGAGAGQPDGSASLAESASAAGIDPAIPGSDDDTDDTDVGEAASPGSDAPAPRFDPDAAIQAPANRGMLHVKPISVAIPRIDVSSTLVNLGLNADNSLEVPEDYSKAGWYDRGSYPGDKGGPPALIVGHVDNSEGPAVFYELDQLKIGDEILVTRADGSTAVFVVYDGEQFPKNSLPTDEIYADRKGSELVLITCSGDFDVEAGSYLDNYVVRAKLDRERSGLDA